MAVMISWDHVLRLSISEEKSEAIEEPEMTSTRTVSQHRP